MVAKKKVSKKKVAKKETKKKVAKSKAMKKPAKPVKTTKASGNAVVSKGDAIVISGKDDNMGHTPGQSIVVVDGKAVLKTDTDEI